MHSSDSALSILIIKSVCERSTGQQFLSCYSHVIMILSFTVEFGNFLPLNEMGRVLIHGSSIYCHVAARISYDLYFDERQFLINFKPHRTVKLCA